MARDFEKIFLSTKNATLSEKIKYIIFIVMYPLSIFGCLLNIVFNISEGILGIKILQTIFVVIAIPIVFNFRGVIEFFKGNDWI